MVMQLEDIYKSIPSSACPSNCGMCCGLLFPSLAETVNIKKWLEVHHRQFIDFNQTVGLDCPYLAQNKSCSIYPVRPYLCRIMGVSGDMRLNCPKCKASRYITKEQTSYLYSQIYLHGKETQRTKKHGKLVSELFATVFK